MATSNVDSVARYSYTSQFSSDSDNLPIMSDCEADEQRHLRVTSIRLCRRRDAIDHGRETPIPPQELDKLIKQLSLDEPTEDTQRKQKKSPQSRKKRTESTKTSSKK
jgi:hypothetical protein